MVAATYGFVSAFGQNIALIPTLTTGMKWFPHRKGLAMGFVVGGFGGGALVFNYIQTAILNPDNVSPASSGPDKDYFTDSQLLARVPNLLLILSGIYLCLGMLACLLITQPPSDWLEQFSDEASGNLDQDYVSPLGKVVFIVPLDKLELQVHYVHRLSSKNVYVSNEHKFD